MFVDRIPNRNSNPTWLIRESKWVNGKAVKTTLANISKLPIEIIDGIRILLKGGTAIKDVHHLLESVCAKARAMPHGHVAAVLGTLRALKLDTLISARNTRVRAIIVALIVSRILNPASKLRTATALRAESGASSLGCELGLENVHDNEVYQAMDWLHTRKRRIEQALAARHLHEGSIVLCDTSSSYVEGASMDLAAFGYSRDGKKKKKQINYGLLLDQEGRPVGIELFPGNTADPSTVGAQLKKVRDLYGLSKVTLVGDRGLLTHARIRDEVAPAGYQWITALRKDMVRTLVEQEDVQPSLFDELDLAELESDDYPGERLMLCRNPIQADTCAHNRERRLRRAERKLDKGCTATQRESRRLRGQDKIALRVGGILGKHAVKRYFTVEITETTFSYQRNADFINRQARLDGLYVIRTNAPEAELSAEETVLSYKALSKVEQAFRHMKTVDLRVRPIHHFSARRIETHFFICMLAEYVNWHIKDRLAPMLYAEEDLEHTTRDRVVAPKQPSAATRQKIKTKTTQSGLRAMSYRSLLDHLATLSKCELEDASGDRRFLVIGGLSAYQKQAFKLLGVRYR